MILEDLINPQIKQLEMTHHVEASNPSFIPIHMMGGIGDVIAGLDAIRFLANRFDVAVYTEHIEAFKYFYKEPISVFKILPEYTWILEFDSYARFKFNEGFHGFLIKKHEELFLQQQKYFKQDPNMETITKDKYNRYFFIAKRAKQSNATKRDFPIHSLGFIEHLDYRFLPKLDNNKYITIHDGIDSSQNIKRRSTKQWKLSHWVSLIKGLKKLYPSYKIIQLGSKKSRPIKGVHKCLINKTSITEAFDILAKSSLHIDGDSGLVHAATRMQVPCVVLWGPTPMEFYGYSQNINIRSNVCSQACYGVTIDWNKRCPIGYKTPKCMDEITPDNILSELAGRS